MDHSGGFGFFLILLLLFAYFIPGLIALGRSSRNAAGIFVLNLLLGWTFLVWVGALIWAICDPKDDDSKSSPPAPAPYPGVTARFADVRLEKPTWGGAADRVAQDEAVTLSRMDSRLAVNASHGCVGYIPPGDLSAELAHLIGERFYSARVTGRWGKGNDRAISILIEFRGPRPRE